MVDFITALSTQLTAANFWAAITPAAALIGTLVLVAFGYFVLRRIIRGASRAKAKI